MKETYISTLETGSNIIDFFMVKSIGLKIGNNNKQYLDVTLGDRTGDISCKKWDISHDEEANVSSIGEGDVVKVSAQVSEWNKNKQLIIRSIRKANQEDFIDMSDFVKAAPEDPQEMYDYILGEAKAMADEDLKKVAVTLMERNKDRLLYYPAAAKNHHAEFAGLLWHMKRMLMSGLSLCRIYDYLDIDLVVTGVIIHDMEKLNEIDSSEQGMASGYSKKGQLLGHIVQGVDMLGSLGKELGIPEEKILVMQHMVLTHHYEPDYGSPKKPMLPEAELLHYLDIMDARLYDIEEAITGIEPGSFSDRVRTLDNRRIYRPEFCDKLEPKEEILTPENAGLIED